MSLALARTHAPGQPEYVRAHSLWVKRTPTCMSGRGSGRGEVALPAGVGLSKFGVGTGFGGCDNTKPGSRNLSIQACFSSESMISCRGHWSHRTTGSQARPVRSRGHRVKPGVWRGAQGGNISRPGSSSRGDARISRDDRQSPNESTAGSAARHCSGSRTGDSDTGFRNIRMSSISRSWPDPGWLIQGV